MSEVVKITDLTKVYKGKGSAATTALRGVNLSIREGDFCAITGPSGCGKTTLLNIIGQVLPFDEGELVIDGISTKKLSDRRKSRMRNEYFGYIVQEYFLIEDLSIRRNIEVPLFYRRRKPSFFKRGKMVTEALSRVGLDLKPHKRVSLLSGGERQRVAIARAIINQPRMILADEPTGALDTENAERIFQLLQDLNRDGTTIILVTHNEELAERCPRRIRMLDGLIL